MDFLTNHSKREHNTVRYGLTIYFLLVAGCITASYFLLQQVHNVQGSILGGTGAILALAVLVTRKNVPNPLDGERNRLYSIRYSPNLYANIYYVYPAGNGFVHVLILLKA